MHHTKLHGRGSLPLGSVICGDALVILYVIRRKTCIPSQYHYGLQNLSFCVIVFDYQRCLCLNKLQSQSELPANDRNSTRNPCTRFQSFKSEVRPSFSSIPSGRNSGEALIFQKPWNATHVENLLCWNRHILWSWEHWRVLRWHQPYLAFSPHSFNIWKAHHYKNFLHFSVPIYLVIVDFEQKRISANLLNPISFSDEDVWKMFSIEYNAERPDMFPTGEYLIKSRQLLDYNHYQFRLPLYSSLVHKATNLDCENHRFSLANGILCHVAIGPMQAVMKKLNLTFSVAG